MEGQEMQARKHWQNCRWLSLNLWMAWVVAVAGCGSAGLPGSASALGEDPGISPAGENAGSHSLDSVAEEIYRRQDEARRMALLGRWEIAIDQYSKAITIEPSYPALYEGRAEAYRSLGRYEQAIRDYSRALAIREEGRLYVERGDVFLELGDYPQADHDYHSGLSLGPLSLDAYVGMGDAHRGMGEFEEAARS